MKLFEDPFEKNGYDFDFCFLDRWETVIGIDEAGRGPLAGPVVSAAVILDYKTPLEGLNDSKKLSPKQRNALTPRIIENSIAVGIGMSFPQEIEEINIFQATIQSMKRALANTRIKKGFLLIDGLTFSHPPFESLKVIKGDQKSPAIMAASILAKTVRDRLMEYYHTLYPGYGFSSHKGYATEAHRQELNRSGPCPIHRKTFEPVKSLLKIPKENQVKI
jgi:ribonuclease HII